MRLPILFFLLGLGVLAGCKKAEPVPVTKVSSNSSSSLVQMTITAKKVYSYRPVLDSVLPGVSVTVYDDEYNRLTHYDLIKSGVTGADGKVTFYLKSLKVYYVEATYNDTDSVHLNVTYPASALIAYEDALFY